MKDLWQFKACTLAAQMPGLWWGDTWFHLQWYTHIGGYAILIYTDIPGHTTTKQPHHHRSTMFRLSLLNLQQRQDKFSPRIVSSVGIKQVVGNLMLPRIKAGFKPVFTKQVRYEVLEFTDILKDQVRCQTCSHKREKKIHQI